ncbi:MAG: DHH family phosphoesterase [Verrucomicrobiota bacterium]|jgi:phosphoesterase RecJ-like protein
MKFHPRIIDRILEKIGQSQRICVGGHVRPDGDCIGSQLALAIALHRQGRQVVCWNEDPVPPKYAFLDVGHVVRKPEAGGVFDLVVALDCASFERLGTIGPAVEIRKCLINIDHHQSNTRYGDLNWISDREASTGELIFRLIKVAGWPISARMADCLFTAVSTDTGSFQYSTTKPGTFHTAGELVKLGAHLENISREIYESFTLSRVRLLQHVYNHFHLTYNDRIAYLWLKNRDFARTGADRDDTEGLIDHIRAIEPVVVACVFEEMGPEMTRISLRSKSEAVNVNDIAAQFGGGGHRAAAGARVAGKPLSVQRRVVAAIQKAIAAAH